MKRWLAALILCILILNLYTPGVSVVLGQKSTGNLLVAMGSGYLDIYSGFSAAAIENAKAGQVRVLVLPFAIASNPQAISQEERDHLLEVAGELAYEIQEDCSHRAPAGITCQSSLAPIFVRTDAVMPAMLDYFDAGLSAVFILDGSPTKAMQVIGQTPVEFALQSLYQQNVVIGGTGGGAAVLSQAMLGGANPGSPASSALNEGALDIWNTPEKHGIELGFQNAILAPKFFETGQVGWLLSAIAQPEAPHLGIGVDGATGARIRDSLYLESIFGRYTVTVLDAETYQSAEGARYQACTPPGECQPVLSLRNVLVQVLAPGDFTYNLVHRQHSLAAPLPTLQRSFADLALPPGAGPLILSGDLSNGLANSPILARFIELSGGENARLLVIAAGFPSDASTTRAANQFAAALPVTAKTLVIRKNSTQPVSLRSSYSGIIFVARDAARLKPELLGELKETWLAGTPLLLDNAAASLAGANYLPYGITPREGRDVETSHSKTVFAGTGKVPARLRAGCGGLRAADHERQPLGPALLAGLLSPRAAGFWAEPQYRPRDHSRWPAGDRHRACDQPRPGHRRPGCREEPRLRDRQRPARRVCPRRAGRTSLRQRLDCG